MQKGAENTVNRMTPTTITTMWDHMQKLKLKFTHYD